VAAGRLPQAGGVEQVLLAVHGEPAILAASPSGSTAMNRTFARTFTAAIAAAAVLAVPAFACSRAVYFGKEGQTITGRTMDWFVSDMDTNLWAYPRGLARSSPLPDALSWTSKYGSVVTTIYEGAAADGMNEKGLVANLLYLAEAEYEPQVAGDKRPTLPISAWVQYILDNFSTTAEAVAAHQKAGFRIVPITAPTGEPGTVHLSVSDASGDSAIFEFIDGKLVIHHGKQYQVMTNSPTYDEQQALDIYWKKIGGSVFLPGTNRASDRYVRLSYYVNEAKQSDDQRAAVATVFSLMRNVSVPIGIKVAGSPNIADTLWLTVSDQKNKVYFFQDTNSPGIVWVDFAKLDFSPGRGARRLTLDGNPDITGNQTTNFKAAEMFKFIVPKN
jgi:choloylglycine hydrolase